VAFDYTPAVSFAKLVQRIKGGVQQPELQRDPLRLATAAILLETAHADGEFSPAEDGILDRVSQAGFSAGR
jgi:uncharacterized tellurite resistance protein B-like protein